MLRITSDRVEDVRILEQVHSPILAFEVLDAVLHDAIIEVITSEVGVASCRLHLHDVVLDRNKRHVQSTATHVVDQNVALHCLVGTAVRDGRRNGFACESRHIQPSHRRRVQRRLSLRLVEASGHGNHHVFHQRRVVEGCQMVLNIFLQLRQQHSQQLLGLQLMFLPLALGGEDWPIALLRHLTCAEL
mmetsp:Transcript_29749/g.79036  ORF Transcript_29749/g.79036 Transcript_29749/m.79036 type:complete len:188 (+) Transcript_29749:1368-1931(+)